MSRRPPLSPRTFLQVGMAVAAILAIATVLGRIEASTPGIDPDFVVSGASEPGGEDITVFTCQRTLPDEPARPRGGTVTRPAGRVQSAEVLSCPDNFDPDSSGGPPVEYVGEVVGDVLERDGGAWVLMNDDAYALETGPLPAHNELRGTNTGLTVWLPDEAIDGADVEPGRPGRRGDVLRVEGRVHRTDPADGGGLTLRARAARVVAETQPASPPFDRQQGVLALVLGAVALAVVGYERSQRP